MSLVEESQVSSERAFSSGGHVLPATTTRAEPYHAIRSEGAVVDLAI